MHFSRKKHIEKSTSIFDTVYFYVGCKYLQPVKLSKKCSNVQLSIRDVVINTSY